jgi:hypothetical protein
MEKVNDDEKVLRFKCRSLYGLMDQHCDVIERKDLLMETLITEKY